MWKKSIIWAELLLVMALILPVNAQTVGEVPRVLFACGDSDARIRECTFGDAAADAVAAGTDAQLSLVTADCFLQNLPCGTITDDELAQCLADAAVHVYSLTPRQLKQLLEGCVSKSVLRDGSFDPAGSSGSFPQISGFRFSYDPSAPSGERILRISIGDQDLQLTDDSTLYTLALTETLDHPGLSLAETDAEASLRLLMTDLIRQGLGEYAVPAERITVVGLRWQLAGGSYALFTIAVIALLFLALLIPFERRLKRFRDMGPMPVSGKTDQK